MANGYSKKIQNRIQSAPVGTIFVNSDFSDIASSETIRRNLNRLVETGELRRIMNGFYEKPEYSELLKEYVEVDLNAIAKAIARQYKWTIVPSGDVALNMLGLSTQVPAFLSFASGGPYRFYQLGLRKIEFKHVANKDITGLSYITALVIQALKALGKTHVNERTIEILRSRLSKEDKTIMLREAVFSTAWVYGVIKSIATS